MSYFFIKRLFSSLPVLIGLSLLAFLLVRLIPGDTATILLGLRYSPESAAALQAELGLDRSWAAQYWLWLKSALQGDFGQSAVSGQSVSQEIISRLMLTSELAFISLVLGSVSGILLGLAVSMKAHPLLQKLAQLVSILGISIPNFWLATMLLMLFSVYAGILPAGAYVPWQENASAHVQSMILPSLSLSFAVMAVTTRMTQSSLAETIHQPYIHTALAKGLSRWQVMRHHALKNALAPVITIIGLQAGSLLGGSIVIEQVFSLPGFGQLILQSVGNRDYPMLQGIILTTGSFFILINILVDMIYRLLDPRIEGHIS
ncbi:MAG: ABC transporter permease [Oligoflexus sp.]